MSTLQVGTGGRTSVSGRRWARLAALCAGVVAAAMLAIPSLAVAHPPACPETWNPAQQPAKFTGVPGGWSTAPGTTNESTPINPDGFFLIGSDAGEFTLVDGCGCTEGGFGGTEDAAGGSCFVYGAFEEPITVKYTEANGKDAAIQPMAGNRQGNGNSTYIDFHLWGQGDLEVCNVVGCSCCRVPPPPFSNEPAP